MGLLKLLRPTAARPELEAPALPSPDWLPVESAGRLLQAHAAIVGKIRQQVGVPAAHWNALYQPLLDGYAEFVQQLPASEAHHHRERGGLLKHGLETALAALTLRRGALLPPGSSAEALAEKQDAWTFAMASAALLHDLGKPVVDQQVALRGSGGENLGQWNALAGPMRSPATYYSTRYVRGRRYRLHPRLPPMLVQHLVPPLALQWLVQDLDVFEAWLAVISGGDSDLAGALGQIIRQADGLSVAADLGAEPRAAAAAGARRPLADRLRLALRKLIDDHELPLNRPGAAGFVVADDLWLVSKRALDALRQELSADSPVGVPAHNERLMDELQQHGILTPNHDRAIWMATVELGDWRQLLSLLRIPLPRLWTDPEARPPAAAAGRVITETGFKHNLAAEAAAEGSAIMATTIPQPEADDALPLPPGPVQSQALATAHPAEDHRLQSPSRDQIAETADSTCQPRLAEQPATSTLAENDLLQWIIHGLTHGRLKINTADARLHMTGEGLLLVSPGIFRDFAGMDGWLNVQKRLLKLKAHLRTADRTNIWTYRVVGERKSAALLKGILIPNAAARLSLRLPEPNPHLVLVRTTPDTEPQAAP